MHFFLRAGDLSSQKDAENVQGTLLQATTKISGKLVNCDPEFALRSRMRLKSSRAAEIPKGQHNV